MSKLRYYYNNTNNTYMVMEPFTGSKLGFSIDLPVKFGDRIKTNVFLELLEKTLHSDKFLFVLDVIFYTKAFNKKYGHIITSSYRHNYVTSLVLKALKDIKKVNLIERFIIRCALKSVEQEIIN